jgi:hypothetical protein
MFSKPRLLLSWIGEMLNGGRSSRALRCRGANFKPWAETLEDRTSPAVFTVTVLTDAAIAPVGSLRAAVNALEAQGNNDTENRLMFANNLNGTINLVAALPTIDKNVQIFEGLSATGGVTIARAQNA